MKKGCIDCGKPAEVVNCGSCSQVIAVCPTHWADYFPVDTPSEIACADCTNAGVGGEVENEKV